MSRSEVVPDLLRERRRFLRRLAAAGIVGLGASVVTACRYTELQVFDHGYYEAHARDDYLRRVPVAPVRGLIYDRGGVLLARNVPSFELAVYPHRVSDLKATLRALAKILPIAPRDVELFRERLRAAPPWHPVPLLASMNPRDVARFEVNRYRYRGVNVRAGLMRRYPLGRGTSHVVGYVGGLTRQDLQHIDPKLYAGLDQIGRSGVEASFENALRGTPGYRDVVVNAHGRPMKTLRTVAATTGSTLHLTLDVRLQRIAKCALGKFNGAVVAVEPHSGEILALASKPGFDASAFAAGLTQKEYDAVLENPARPLYDRSLQGLYAPASTIKPYMAFAALNAGTLTPKTRYFCPGYYVIPGTTRRFYCWKRSGHGWLDMQHAIEQSCDVYFYHVARKLGIARIDAALPAFGFGRRTGVRLPDELSGLLPNPGWVQGHFGHPWYPGETLNTGIGQGIWQVTPVQLANAACRIALNGHGRALHIVRSLTDARGGRVHMVKPRKLPPIAEAHAREWLSIVGGMQMVAQDPLGTAWGIGRDAPYRIAAKTGTAQVTSSVKALHGGGTRFEYHENALFISFAPAENPRIVVAVVAEKGADGGFVAGPVAREVMDAYLLGHVEYRPQAT
ncbi:MAG TPA: penicillin-binding protein 2 [Nevskiaceae bacterium]